MRRAAPMPVEVDVPRKHRGLASQRCIKRVVCRREFLLVHMGVTMVMLGELCLVGLRVTTMLDGDRDVKAVRFRNFLGGFQYIPCLANPKTCRAPPSRNVSTVTASARTPERRKRGGTPASKIDNSSTPSPVGIRCSSGPCT